LPANVAERINGDERDEPRTGYERSLVRFIRKHWTPITLAAALVLAVVITSSRRRTVSGAIAPAEIVALLEQPPNSERVPVVDWSRRRGWSPQSFLQGLAVRYGAQALDLEMAVREHDSAARVHVASEIVRSLVADSGYADARRVYRLVARREISPGDSLEVLLERGWALATRVAGPHVKVGAWLAALRSERSPRSWSARSSWPSREPVRPPRTYARWRSAAPSPRGISSVMTSSYCCLR
jgi:hypothetical protein